MLVKETQVFLAFFQVKKKIEKLIPYSNIKLLVGLEKTRKQQAYNKPQHTIFVFKVTD